MYLPARSVCLRARTMFSTWWIRSGMDFFCASAKGPEERKAATPQPNVSLRNTPETRRPGESAYTVSSSTRSMIPNVTVMESTRGSNSGETVWTRAE